MARYWLKIEDSVEGPYESHLLKFVDGFNKETFACPEESEGEEFWKRAEEFPELRKVLGIPEPPATAAEIPAEPKIEIPPAETEKEEISASLPKTPEPAKIQEPIAETTATSVPTEEVPSLLSAPENKVEEKLEAENELLEVMEKIEEEKRKQEEQELISIAPLSEEVLPEETKETGVPVPVRPQKKLKIAVSLLLLGCIGGAALFWKPHLIQKLNFLSNLAEKSGAKKEPIRPEPIQEIAIPPKPIEKKIEKIVQASQGKPKPKPQPIAKKTIAKSTATVKEEELKHQKYLLPGVPSPQVSQEKQKQSSPPIEKEDDKKKKREKQFKDVEWMSKTGW